MFNYKHKLVHACLCCEDEKTIRINLSNIVQRNEETTKKIIYKKKFQEKHGKVDLFLHNKFEFEFMIINSASIDR